MAPYFPTQNGRIKIQAETLLGTDPGNGWVYQAPGTGNNAGGAQGGYYYFKSETLDGSVKSATQGQFSATIYVAETGLYDLRVRTARDTNNPGDSRNDIWVRVDDHINSVLPAGTVAVETTASGYAKLKGANTAWGYARLLSALHEEDANAPSQVLLTQGFHTISFAGRSVGLHIDFFELVKTGLNVAPGAPDTAVVDGPVSGPPIVVRVLDTTTNTVVDVLEDGDVLDARLVDGSMTLVVGVVAGGALAGEVGSMGLRLTGASDVARIETGGPYSLFGENGGGYLGGGAARAGDYNFSVDVYSGAGGRGRLLDSFDFNFEVRDPAPDPVRIGIYDARTNKVVHMLKDGDVLDAAMMDGNMTAVVHAVAGGALHGKIGSVTFQLSGASSATHTDSAAPYALFGDFGGNLRGGGAAAPGNYTLEVDVYSGRDGAGTTPRLVRVRLHGRQQQRHAPRLIQGPR